MRKTALVLVVLLASIGSAVAQSSEYRNGNGTVLDLTRSDNVTWTTRKHVQRIQIGDIPGPDSLVVHSDHSDSAGVVTRMTVGEVVDISRVAEEVVNSEYYVWLQLTTSREVTGWVFLGKYSSEYAQFLDPYFDNRWAITGNITTSRDWTFRKMIYERVAVGVVLNIRDKPGLTGTKVISKILSPKDATQINLDVMEATEETETIDGKTDRWLKIRCNGAEGWIFGGYADVMRGGYKYYTPENIILSQMGYSP
jgi:hypothetical protein